MIVLLDASPSQWETAVADMPGVEVGQLISAASRHVNRGLRFAIDNGAFAKQGFSASKFQALLERNKAHREKCLWVACPDVVGSARRTLEVFTHWYPRLHGWPVAFVAQDGQGSLPIPWDVISAIFIGGTTRWKLGRHAEAIIRAAQLLGKWVHVGRVNTRERARKFFDLGVNSIDGTGISRFSDTRDEVAAAITHPTLNFTQEQS